MKVGRCDWKYVVCGTYAVVMCWATGASGALPLDPDNAALLYYQAALVSPEPDVGTQRLLNDVLRGGEPNGEVRQYVAQCSQAIRFTEAAAQREHAIWGVLYSQGDDFQNIIAHLRQLALLVEVDARIQVADGNNMAAFNKALNMRRLARHIADGTNWAYGASLGLDYRALLAIQHILGVAPPSVETIMWLQAQLDGVQAAPQSPARQLEMTLDHSLQYSRVHPESITQWREFALTTVGQGDTKANVQALTDEQVLDQAEESADRFAASVQQVIGSAKPYVQKRNELQQLADGLDAQIRNGDPVGLLFLFRYSVDDLVVKQYDVYTRGVAHYNAVGTATEIYAESARVGQLPDEIPAYVPKDPFSGEDFEYQASADRFVLRCREKEIGEDRIWEYEFIVRGGG